MKNILLILSLTFSVTLFGQQNTYYIEDINSINDSISKRLELYARDSFSHNLVRISELDAKAKIRNSYFISVKQETSKTGKEFYYMMDSTAKGKEGHRECFGNPRYFAQANIPYPEIFQLLNNLNLKVSSEIMYQIVWFGVLNKKQTSCKGVVKIAIDNIKKNYSVSKLSQLVIRGYNNSASHKNIIKKRGDGKYGSSTMFIVSEKQLRNGKWLYEVEISNLIIFTKKN